MTTQKKKRMLEPKIKFILLENIRYGKLLIFKFIPYRGNQYYFSLRSFGLFSTLMAIGYQV